MMCQHSSSQENPHKFFVLPFLLHAGRKTKEIEFEPVHAFLHHKDVEGYDVML